MKNQIPAHKIHQYLRYAIKIKAGRDYNHILNDSIYDIDLDIQGRTVVEGEALCGRFDTRYHAIDQSMEICPGCIAIARGLAVRDAVGR